MDEEFDTTEEELTSRAPRQKDLAALASELNRLGAAYIVIGGFARRKQEARRSGAGMLQPLSIAVRQARDEGFAGVFEGFGKRVVAGGLEVGGDEELAGSRGFAGR